MTKEQQKSSIWFAIFTIVVTLISILATQKISTTDLSNVTRAATVLNRELQERGIFPSGTSTTPVTVVSTPELLSSQSLGAYPLSPTDLGIPRPTSSVSAKVVRVIDGDTIELEDGQKVRYIGINTPELHHPQKGAECFGEAAYVRNKTLVEGKIVQLQKDVSETDRYGRLLRYVWVDDTLVNESLVREGYAFSASFPPDISLQKYLDAAQQRAQDTDSGLWSKCPAVLK